MTSYLQYPVETIHALLSSVKRKPALYNFDAPRRNTEAHLRNRLWEEVAADVRLTAPQCKIIWQQLRAGMRKEQNFRKQGGEQPTNWQWYEAMLFFVPYFHNFIGRPPKSKGQDEDQEYVDEYPAPATSNGKIKSGQGSLRASLSSGLQRFKKKASNDSKLQRKSAPRYAAKTTLPSHRQDPYQRPPAPLPMQHLEGNSSSRASQSSERAAFGSPSPAAGDRRQLSGHQPSLKKNELPSITTSSSASPPDGESAGKIKEKKTLQDFSEYHFVSCLLEMLEDVPINKRSLAKAKIMAEIAQAYQ